MVPLVYYVDGQEVSRAKAYAGFADVCQREGIYPDEMAEMWAGKRDENTRSQIENYCNKHNYLLEIMEDE